MALRAMAGDLQVGRNSRHIVVIGAGVIGITSAYYLAANGHKVTVIDRNSGPALETSFANAGMVSPGYSSPWASPAVPLKIPSWLLREHAPLLLRPRLSPNMLLWLLAMLRNCTRRRYAVNKERMVRLAEYSRRQLIELRGTTGIEYDSRTRGTLQLFRAQAELDAVASDIEVLQKDGVPYEILDPAGCIAAEPGLATATASFVGGLRLPNDETGDCYKFTSALAQIAARLGVEFRYDCEVRGYVAAGNRISAVATSRGNIAGGGFVVAAGSYSPALIRRWRLRLPVYPVKGYSLTTPITDFDHAPQSTIMDESCKIAITRLGDRVRVGGMAEISGFTHDIKAGRKRTLLHSLETLFPGTTDARQREFWSGLRPMTPDGTPVVGKTPVDNLYLNTGHGTLGWTMACGSARILADIIAGQTPEIDVSDLSIGRYTKAG